MTIFTNLTLSVSPEKLYLQPIDSPNEVLIIDRVSHEVTLDGFTGQVPTSATNRVIYGIVGIVHLLAGPHLIVITRVSKVGNIYNETIWKVEETEIISYSRTTWHLTEEQVHFNNSYLAMVRTVLNTHHFYYCSSYDLTHTLQRLCNAGPDFLAMSLLERAEQRFVWNASLLKDLSSRAELQNYCLPLLHGFVSIKTATINSKAFVWSLISRRSVLRAGTRLFVRGLDKDGNAANYVETEQIVEYENCRSSFVQIRGSIPLYWSQLPNLKYKPAPQLSLHHNQLMGFQKHVDQMIGEHGKVVIVNLINHKGQELVLEKELTNMVRTVNNNLLRYESFDFHHECRNMRWDRLSILMDRISQDQVDIGYFLMSADGTVLSLQEGTFRTNCVDSLDRTNVVQGLIARKSLEDQLKRLSILVVGEKIEDHSAFEYIYRNAWADNADTCSIQYAGTGALKTDYTRTGKRTQYGLMRDGMNSLIRYYKNNFADGFRQDAIDLFLGNYRVNDNEAKLVPCPLKEKKDWKYLALPTILLGSMAMFFFSIFLPAEHTMETFLYLLFWAGMVSLTLTVIIFYGTEFVDFPKLCEVKPKKKAD